MDLATHTTAPQRADSTPLPFPDVLDRATRTAADALGVREAVLFLYDDVADSFTLAATEGVEAPELRGAVIAMADADSIGSTLEESRARLVPAMSGFRSLPGALPALCRRPMLLVPLWTGSPVGVLAVPYEGRELPEPQRDRAEAVGRETAQLIQSARPDAGHYCLFRRIVSLSPAGFAVVEGHQHVFSYAAPAFRHMLGLETTHFLGRSASDVMGTGTCASLLDEVRRTGMQQQVTATEVSDEYGARFYDSHVIPERGIDGSTLAIYIVLWPRTDVVQTRRALEETIAQLATSRSTLASVLDGTINGVFFYDLEGRIEYANRRTGQLLGIDPQAAIGRSLIEFATSELMDRIEGRDEFVRRLREIHARPEEPSVDTVTVLAPQRRVLERHSTPAYREDGTLMGRIDVYSDVTEVRNLQRNKDDFLSVVSHELKTPVTSIKGYIQLLRKRAERDGTSQQTLAAYEIIERQTVRMQSLIDMLLDLTRLESGPLALHMESVELTSLISEAIDLTRMTSDEHTIRYLGPDTETWIEGDASRLEQVLLNLLSNAVRYSPNGGTIDVSLTAQQSVVHITVSDEGVGIAPDGLSRIFERFYHAGAGDSDVGLGIGLYICRSIVEEHGGEITVQSAPAVGSTFTVTLPTSQHER